MASTQFPTMSAALVAAMVAATFACGGGSSPPVSNPVPTIANMSPSTATRGGPAFTLTVNGSNFASGAAVQWNGNARPTTLVNAGQVTAQISADDIAVADTEKVNVINPGPGGGTSNSLAFNIPCVLAPPTPASSQTLTRLGAYYFDGWAGPLTSYNLAQLVNGPNQNLQPLSGWRDDNKCAVEQQLAWAHSFGLNFFIFDWYFNAQIAVPTQNLNSAFEITRSLPDRHGMQYAILYVNSSPFIVDPADWASAVKQWVTYMADPNYVRINGKPLFSVNDMRQMRQTFGSSSATVSAFSQLRSAAIAAGFPGIYLVGGFSAFDGSSGVDGLFPNLSMAVADGYDAATMYIYGFELPITASGQQPFSELADDAHWLWGEGAVRSPLAFIPVVTDGFDSRPVFQYAGQWETGRPEFWVARTPADVAALTSDAIIWAESNPQVQPEPSPSAPIVLLGTWNELSPGDYIIPTVGNGTTYGDALALTLATPPIQARSILSVRDSGPSDPNRSASGLLTDANGFPIAGASIMLTQIPANGSFSSQYQVSGLPPALATQAIVGFRVNTDDPSLIWPVYFFAGPGASDFNLYNVSYIQPSDGVERVPNGDFSSATALWSLRGQTQLVPSDRGSGQMVQVVTTPSQFAALDSAPFAITQGQAFQVSFSARIAPSAAGSGYFFLGFQDASGNFLTIPAPSAGALHAESIPFAAAKSDVGTATTDARGNFQLSLTSLGTSQAMVQATYSGDAQHWPAYARTGP